MPPVAFDSSGSITGSIVSFTGSAIPAGYLACDGSQVSRTTYAELFGTVNTLFGSGNGSTTFHIPDLRGRFLRGIDDLAGIDPDVGSRTAMNSGGATGNNVGSVQGDLVGSHTHPTYGGNLSQSGTDPYWGSRSPNSNIFASTGSETRPKNAYVRYIIKF